MKLIQNLDNLTRQHKKVLFHIIANENDRALKGKCWKQIKIDLWHLGLIERRVGDWAFIPTKKQCNKWRNINEI